MVKPGGDQDRHRCFDGQVRDGIASNDGRQEDCLWSVEFQKRFDAPRDLLFDRWIFREGQEPFYWPDGAERRQGKDGICDRSRNGEGVVCGPDCDRGRVRRRVE